ncbi:MAG: hypothetical protein K9L21_04425 [Spirochaetia bacterium]|nr:hypothetical protein [Spirochaetia bacterium]
MEDVQQGSSIFYVTSTWGYIQQCPAYCLDAGKPYIPYHENPVIAFQSRSDFRDPKVIWHTETESCGIFLAGRDNLLGQIDGRIGADDASGSGLLSAASEVFHCFHRQQCGQGLKPLYVFAGWRNGL